MACQVQTLLRDVPWGKKRQTGQTHPRKILLFSRLDFKTKVKTTLLFNIHSTEPLIELSVTLLITHTADKRKVGNTGDRTHLGQEK